MGSLFLVHYRLAQLVFCIFLFRDEGELCLTICVLNLGYLYSTLGFLR